jgi:hypothetical protein
VGCGVSEFGVALFCSCAVQPGAVEHKYCGTVPSFCLFWVLFDLFFLFCFSALSFTSFEESQTKGNVQDIHN